jgi:hypothetical protein
LVDLKVEPILLLQLIYFRKKVPENNFHSFLNLFYTFFQPVGFIQNCLCGPIVAVADRNGSALRGAHHSMLAVPLEAGSAIANRVSDPDPVPQNCYLNTDRYSILGYG